MSSKIEKTTQAVKAPAAAREDANRPSPQILIFNRVRQFARKRQYLKVHRSTPPAMRHTIRWRLVRVDAEVYYFSFGQEQNMGRGVVELQQMAWFVVVISLHTSHHHFQSGRRAMPTLKPQVVSYRTLTRKCGNSSSIHSTATLITLTTQCLV